MAYATRTYTPGSSTTTFALTTSGGDPIGYIQESDISVKVNGTTYTNAASGTNTYQISGTSTVEQPNGGNVVLNAGVTGTVILERTTAIQDATVVYTAGSTLTSTDLNNADNQIRFGLQEFDDKYAALTAGTGNLTSLGGFLGSSDTWVSDNSKAPTTGAADARTDSKIATALTGDVVGTTPVNIADNSPSSGKITVSLDAELVELATMSSGTASALADLTGTEVQILDGATLTTTELNYVDGVTSAIQTQIDGKQATATDLTTLSSMQSGAATELASLTSTELDILDGATVTTNELNILDGVTATATELNILDGVTSTTAELNILDGVTATTAELNYVDGVTSNVQTQVDAKQPLDADLTTLAGMQSGTASILAGGTALTSTLTELNQLDGKTLGETSLTTNSNTAIPTSKAVADHVASSVTNLGGFVAISGPTNFPSTQPDQGVVVSISDVGSGFTTSSNEITITNGAGTGNNVRITGFPTSLAATTLQDDTGIQVTSDKNNSTSGSPNVHRYVYHKWLAKEDDIKQLSDDINEFGERYRITAVGASLPAVTDTSNDDGDLIWHTDGSKMYVYNAAYSGGSIDRANSTWDQVQSIGDFKFLVLTNVGTSNAATYNGSTATFDLKETSVSGSAAGVTSAFQLMVSVNGVIQKPNAGANPSGLDGFVMGDGSNNASTSKITFCAGPPANADVFVIQSGSAVTLNAPANNTVGTNQLQNLAVNNGKIADDTIEEVKLDIHNAPSGTDKFLKYTSNGMEWVVPSYTTNTNILSGGTITGDVIFDNATNAGNDLTWDMSDNALEFDDNVKAKFGDGGDLVIHHDGNNSFIDEAGTGDLLLTATAGSIQLKKNTGDKMLQANVDGSVQLYHANTEELATKDGGVKLFGHSECAVNALGNVNSNPTFDFTVANYITMTLTGNVTVQNPTTESVGQSGSIIITQDGTGSRTAAWGNQFKWAGGAAPTLSTAANAVDRIDYVVVAADTIHCVASLAIA